MDLQDQFGDLSDELWNLLRRVRTLELQGRDLTTLKEDLLDLELESFARRVNPDLHEQLREVLKCVPGLLGIIGKTSGL